MLTVGKPSFSLNFAEEVRPDCRNLQRSTIMVNFSEMLLVGIQQEYGLLGQKSCLVCGFKNLGWSRISSIDLEVGKFLLVKCSQVLVNWVENSSLLCFCKFLCLLDLRRFFVKRLWLEFKIEFNQHSMKSFQRALMGSNNFWIFLSF